MRNFKQIFFILALTLSGTAQAKVIQILHTNDLHAALETAGAAAEGKPTYGGWAQIKTTMDQLTASAKDQGFETIRLDAGDFFEGTISYFPDQGFNVLKAFQSMGYDAAVMGNHDWLMGPQNMNKVFGKAPFPFPILSANTKFSPYLTNLKSQIIPTTEINKNGIKIGIVGLSTDEMFYKWITKVDSYKNDMIIRNYRDTVDPADLANPVIGIANDRANSLQKNNDLVIALTHIGYKEDRKLAASSTNIDLIIGGHSHTRLESLGIVENRKGEMIPIVQTGATGVFIGKILVDVNPGKKAEVLSYELVPVLNETTADPVIADLLVTSEQRINDLYGKDKLDEVIGHSEARLVSGSYGATAYSRFMVDAMKDATGADIALDMGEFHSNSAQPAGDVTRRKLMEMYPRKLNVEQNEGLYVYTFKIPGWALKLALNLAVKFGYDLSMSGIEYNTYFIDEQQLAAEQNELKSSWKGRALTDERLTQTSITIGGKPLKLFKHYRVATPEFVIRGAYAISWLTRLVLRHGRPTYFTMWDAAEQYLAKIRNIPEIPNFKSESLSSTHKEFEFGDELITDMLKEVEASPYLNSSEEKDSQ